MNGCHMGVTAEEIVKRYGISRDDQDAFAAESQRRAAEAVTPAPSIARSWRSTFRSGRARR